MYIVTLVMTILWSSPNATALTYVSGITIAQFAGQMCTSCHLQGSLWLLVPKHGTLCKQHPAYSGYDIVLLP